MARSERITRRHYLRDSLLLSGMGFLCSHPLTRGLVEAAESKSSTGALNRLPRVVHEHFVPLVCESERRSLAALEAMKTQAEAQTHVQAIREKIKQCFGPFPEKTPLNARVTGVVERPTYRIEKVIFESRPAFFVTANLYIPKQAKFPAPAAIQVCGHSDNGKAYSSYQAACQGLVKKGFVVLIFDPIGQGERLQFPGKDAKSLVGAGVNEHLMGGNQQFLVGEFFGAWQAWDGIRALDYLLSRPEVDPQRVGITGNSGGGTMTTWLCGVDQRWSMAAPSCFVTTFRRNLENELPADTEQCPPHALALGLDHADFLAALAPKPIILLSQERDYFDVRGTREAARRLKKLYELLGASPDPVQHYVGPEGHGFHQGAREAMYGLFLKASGLEGEAQEAPFKPEEDRTLWCTPHGQVEELKSRSISAFTRETAQQFSSSISKGEANSKQAESELQQTVHQILSLPAHSGEVPFRVMRPRRTADYPYPRTSDFLLEVEPGMQAIVYRNTTEAISSAPPRQTSPAILYVAHDSSDAELKAEPLIRELCRADPAAVLYALDVRGLGETKPNTCGENSYDSPYGCDYFYAIHGLMLDKPYVGQRTLDVLRTLDWLGQIGHKEVHLVARGYGTIPGAYAALLHDVVNRVTLKNALVSYRSITEQEIYQWPLSSFTPGVLKKFDLPDVYRTLAKKQLRQVDLWDAHRNVIRN